MAIVRLVVLRSVVYTVYNSGKMNTDSNTMSSAAAASLAGAASAGGVGDVFLNRVVVYKFTQSQLAKLQPQSPNLQRITVTPPDVLKEVSVVRAFSFLFCTAHHLAQFAQQVKNVADSIGSIHTIP